MATIDMDKMRYIDILFPWDEIMCRIEPDPSTFADDEEEMDAIPLVNNGYWHGVIDLKEHRILGLCTHDWPMSIQCKVRDSGTYTLLDEDMKPICSYSGYVPELPFDKNDAWGDYLRFFLDKDGIIQNWNKEFSAKEFIHDGKPLSPAEFERVKELYLGEKKSQSGPDMSDMLVKAAKLMLNLQSGQVDKAGQPYFWHPIRVALKCETPEQKIVAILHDVFEDTQATAQYLLDEGFSKEIVEAIESVTKRDGEHYNEFIARCSLNPIGRIVKIHDLEDNLDVTRLPEMCDSDIARVNKYLKSLRFLKSL